MKRLVTESYQIASEKLPEAFDGVKIAYLSDLHNASFGPENEDLLVQLQKESPDYVFLGGDMIVGTRRFVPEVALKLCRQLVNQYPVYMGIGNHEQKLAKYEETKESRYPAYLRELKQLGVVILDNTAVRLQRQESEVWLYGLTMDYRYYGKWWKQAVMQPDYLTEQLGVCRQDSFSILLAHNPKYFQTYASWGADLVLSGHVHGGIIILPGLGGVIAPDYVLFPRYDSGYFREAGSQMVLSRGLGVHTIKLRMFNPPELSVITLQRRTATDKKGLAKTPEN